MAMAAAEITLNGGFLPVHVNGFLNGDSEDHEELPVLDGDDEDEGNNNIPTTKVVSVDDRIKRKAKRPSVLLAARETALTNGLKTALNGAHPKTSSRTLAKNSRRSRAGFGRGLPKKGGAGGKGTWGKIGSELIAEEDDDIEDTRDPNYDSDSQDNIELESFLPELSEEELEKYVDPILHEYYEHGDTNEVILSLDEINLKGVSHQVVVMAINLAMERKPSHRELTSVMISDLFGRVLTQEDIGKGFDLLLTSLTDLVLDTPDAPIVLGNFIARAVADDCIPPMFVQGYRGKVDCQHARASLEHADTLLSMKHGLVRLDNVWGVGGGMRPVKYLIRKIQLLLQEYLSSGDMIEAVRCLQELEVPHFHHELVYEAIIMVIEDMGERAMDLICKLLKFMASTIIVTPDQMKRGFERVYQELPEISIDVPPAYTILENLLTKCHQAGFVPQDLVKSMPSRGRKRFVSEGDGGRIKEEEY